ncbi:MAG TPA: prepilin-type N-terminal cleavage/methylation domain-containing protein [Candidatus Angelobacter sp.]|jgi:prepilin-type N-terminal cleavage/methylation domain-containing protein
MTKHTKAKGFSLIELLIVVAIILIIAGIAIPNLLRSRMSANEAAAVSVLRNVHNSQAVYVVEYTSSVGYANSLIKLGPGNPCSKITACLTDQLVGCAAEPCLKSGYLFFMNSTSAAEPFGDYTATATPVTWKGSGNNNFCTTEDGVIRKQKAPAGSLSAAEIHSNCIDIAQYNPLGN